MFVSPCACWCKLEVLDVSSFLSPLFSGGRHETELVCGEAMKSKTLSYITRTFDSVDSISQVDVLTVDQWNGTPCLQPEKTLMFAVLLDAVECFQKYAGHEANRLFKDTDEWIFEDDPEWPFSFINICEAVGMDPEYLRKGLSQLNRERSKGRTTVDFIPRRRRHELYPRKNPKLTGSKLRANPDGG